MPVKRSRESSSAHIEKPAVTVACPLKVMKTEAAAAPPQPTVLGISPVWTVAGCDNSRIGGFLERCHYCRKRIPQNSHIFMYSTLCAFCSQECRDFQMTLDQFPEKEHNDLKGKMPMQGQGFHNRNGQ